VGCGCKGKGVYQQKNLTPDSHPQNSNHIFSVATTTTTRTISTPTTTASSSIVISASWTFDQTTGDSYGVYNGTLMGGATYSVASTTQPYLANGRALTLSSASQSFLVSTPFLNLTYTSITVEAWIYPTNITGDHGIFSQCTCSTCANQCLVFILRSNHLYVDFNLNGLYGSTTIAINTWYHVAFTYNYATAQQILYVNGVQDAIASNVNPYQGTNASIQIGVALISSAAYYFIGYIDNVKLVTRAKSSTEILFDASVTAYYSFDLSSLNNDNGPNGFYGLAINTITVEGRVNEAIHFSGASSYFQIYGFYQLVYSILGSNPFSVSFWMNPSAVSSSTIVQVTQQQSSGACYNMIGIISATGLTGQLMVQGYHWPIIYGPFLTTNIWTHVSVTYSITDGMILYINGIFFGSTGSFVLSGTGWITWVQIGFNFVSSGGGNVPNNVYQGSIDEFYVHSRELTQTDVTALANP
jgi:hypothetical protein